MSKERELPPDVIYLVPSDDGYDWLWCEDPAPGVGMEEEDSVKYLRVKPSITTERLAEILEEINKTLLSQQYSRLYFKVLATELLKKCDIREKE